MNLVEAVKGRLSIFKNLYDVVRVIDPVNKEIIIVKDGGIEKSKEDCYKHWEKNTFCENCISMRAYLNNDTFVKIEYAEMKVILVIASPIEVDGKVYIVEILKDITKSGSVVCNFYDNSSRVEELISEMNRKVIKDELTGAYNRRYINERLVVDINSSKKSENPLSIIMADIDHFKNINDTYGHVIGDRVLADFIRLIMNSIRKATDWVGRYGGEEFIIVLNNTDSKTAAVIAEKIRNTLEKITFTYGDISIKMTSSFGVCDINDAEADLTSLISRADNSLYKAKLSGRNRIVS